MARNKTSRKAKPRENLADRIARQILPDTQAARKDYRLVDVANETDADSRHIMRSGQRKTIRKLSRIESLTLRRAITKEQEPIIQWYADQFEMGYATVGCTANYQGAGGGGYGSSDLLARYTEQAQARDNYRFASESIPPTARKVFERVVLDQGKIGSDRVDFRLAVAFLEKAVGHLIAGE